MRFILSCEKCGAVRYRTHQNYVNQADHPQLAPEDFEPMNGAPPLKLGDVCYVCGGRLRAGKMPDSQDSHAESSEEIVGTQGLQGPTPAFGHVLFEASPGEDVKQMKEMPGGNLLITTSRRVLYLNISALTETNHAVPHV